MRPSPQSVEFRELVADVRARPPEEGDRLCRGYRNPSAQKLHTDSSRPSTFGIAQCDILATLCVRPSAKCGASRLMSAEALHTAIAAERPDLFARLRSDWPWDAAREW